jgi:beta-phosphoglucomutase-like phosphatase (HAD superfamily)
LLRYFDFVIAAGDYARSKPDPAPYIAAIARAGLEADACIAIEDSERGLHSATRAGIRCIIVPSGLTTGQLFAGADRILRNVTDVPEVLYRMAWKEST